MYLHIEVKSVSEGVRKNYRCFWLFIFSNFYESKLYSKENKLLYANVKCSKGACHMKEP